MHNKALRFFLTAGLFSATCQSAEEAVQKLEEVVVTGSSQNQSSSRSAKPTLELSGDKLLSTVGQTIGETLQNEPGMNNQSFGAGVGTPVIRGQTGSRVRVLQNSLGNNDVSSLSPDHANGVDPIIAERIEVLRGPSTLLYGSGAIGGIVNVIDNRIPERVPDKLIGGAGEQRYDSATGQNSSTVKLEGGKNAFAYHVDGFYRDQDNTSIGGTAIDESAVRLHDPSFNSLPVGELQNSDGFISNTQARSRGGSVGFSSIGEKGLLGVAINTLEKNYGIPPDGHGEEPVSVNLNQTKYDLKGQLKKPIAGIEMLRVKFGYTDYQHVEMNGDIPGTTYLNETYESRLEIEHLPFGPLKGTIGFQSSNSQFVGLGEEAQIVPKSAIDSFALFAVEAMDLGSMTYQFGGRIEGLTLDPEGLANVAYIPVSGSASALWHLSEQQQLTLGFTHSERAPQIQELFSDGFHHATRSYEKGNPDLQKEISNNLDLSYRYNGSWITTELNLFHNWVSDYIYQQRSDSTLFNADAESLQNSELICDECFPLLNTQQGAGIFKGYEAKVNVPLMDSSRYGAVDLELFSDYTRGTFDNGADVPRMPPLRYGFQVSFEKSAYSGNIRLTRAEAQTNPGLNETSTSGYLLLNLNTQYRLANFHQTEILFFAKGKNLLDENIRNSTSYLRNFAPEPGRSAEIGIRVSY